MKAETAILDATLRLVARGGVDAVRYRDVAAEAGVSLGSVSYHHPAREGLIRAAFAHFLQRNTATLTTLRDRAPAATAEGVAELMTEVLRRDFADPERPWRAEYELIVYASRDPAVAEALAAWDRATCAEIAAVLEPLDVPRPFEAARTLLDLLRGFQLANLGRPDRDLDDFRARAARVLRALATPEPRSAQRIAP